MKHINIQVFGLVQGIFFRVTAKQLAEKLGILGFAENKTDGSVYIEAEGKREKLDQFVSWCHQGPPQARVEKVIVIEDKIKNFSGFQIY